MKYYDLFCLHLMYIPLIQQFINEFIRSWNLHGLSTVRAHLSPVRLFESGLFTLRERGELNGENYAEVNQVLQHKLRKNTSYVYCS